MESLSRIAAFREEPVHAAADAREHDVVHCAAERAMGFLHVAKRNAHH